MSRDLLISNCYRFCLAVIIEAVTFRNAVITENQNNTYGLKVQSLLDKLVTRLSN